MDAGSSDAGARSPAFLTSLPQPNQWGHITVDVVPDPSGDGSGTLTFDLRGSTAGAPQVPIMAGTLTAQGAPLVGFAANVTGPSGPLEVQYDNVIVDLLAQ